MVVRYDTEHCQQSGDRRLHNSKCGQPLRRHKTLGGGSDFALPHQRSRFAALIIHPPGFFSETECQIEVKSWLSFDQAQGDRADSEGDGGSGSKTITAFANLILTLHRCKVHPFAMEPLRLDTQNSLPPSS